MKIWKDMQKIAIDYGKYVFIANIVLQVEQLFNFFSLWLPYSVYSN